MLNIGSILADEIQKEIDKEISRNIFVRLKYHEAIISKTKIVDTSWCNTYIKNKYQHFDEYWYFISDKDAALFSLKWSA